MLSAFSSQRGSARTRWGLAIAGLLLVLASLLLAPSVGAREEIDWDTVEPTPVLTGLAGPIDIAIAPEGEIWWNEFYSGNVTRWDPDDGSREVVFHADPIPDPVERGMLGLALDPDVTSNGVFYVYYTVEDPHQPRRGTNYLSRIEDGEETRLLQVPAHKRHNGGRITFDDEGRLFVSTGDNTQGYPAQDPEPLLGKILHLYPNGTPAEDTMEGYVYSMGHRNVYGLAYDSSNDRLFATENNDLERDEINIVEAGVNYGWPHCQGTLEYDFEAGEPTEEPCDRPDLRDPIAEFYEEYTAAPTGATVFQGDLYWTAWNEGQIHRLTYDSDAQEWRDRVVHDTDGHLHDIEAHRGSLYYANWTSILRIDGPGNGTGSSNPKADVDPGEPPNSDPGTGDDDFSEVPAIGFLVQGLAVAGLALRERRETR